MSLVLNGVALCFCRSFAEDQRKYKSTNEIDSAAIAAKFQCISGTQIYGKVAWREWCTLERSLTQETLAWLGKVGSRTKTNLPMVCQVIEVVYLDVLHCRFFCLERWWFSTKTALRLLLKLCCLKLLQLAWMRSSK